MNTVSGPTHKLDRDLLVGGALMCVNACQDENPREAVQFLRASSDASDLREVLSTH